LLGSFRNLTSGALDVGFGRSPASIQSVIVGIGILSRLPAKSVENATLFGFVS
jgi:hypothetical protein